MYENMKGLQRTLRARMPNPRRGEGGREGGRGGEGRGGEVEGEGEWREGRGKGGEEGGGGGGFLGYVSSRVTSSLCSIYFFK